MFLTMQLAILELNRCQVEIPENIKMRNIITKAIEDYRQCALSKGHLYHIWLVAESKDSLLFLEKYFKRLR